MELELVDHEEYNAETVEACRNAARILGVRALVMDSRAVYSTTAIPALLARYGSVLVCSDEVQTNEPLPPLDTTVSVAEGSSYYSYVENVEASYHIRDGSHIAKVGGFYFIRLPCCSDSRSEDVQKLVLRLTALLKALKAAEGVGVEEDGLVLF